MATGISWADETWNPITGCTPISTGCAHCYAARTALRLGRMPTLPQYRGLAQQDLLGRPMWTGTVRCVPEALDIPWRWVHPRTIFLGSMSDAFHEQVPREFLDRIWAVMTNTDHLYLVLTKRPERMLEYVLAHTGGRRRLDNVWVGTSMESTQQLHRLAPLLKCRGLVGGTFLSLEPLLDDIADELAETAQGLPGHMGDISRFVRWIVAGGESGAGARPLEAEWVRCIRDMCWHLEIPFHFKQWGPVGRGRALDGRIHDWRPTPDECLSQLVSGPCATCGAPAHLQHGRCRGCLSAHRRVLGVAS